METSNMGSVADIKPRLNLFSVLLGGAAGFLIAALLFGGGIMANASSLMLIEEKSKLDYEETVDAVKRAAEEQGWTVSGASNLQASLKKHGVDFPRKVQVVNLCKADYAERVLRDDLRVACLMPCSIAVYEDKQGEVRLAKMNTGLMGPLFGGAVANVMGTEVSKDIEAMLRPLVQR